jgi:hypothetical protein
VRIVSDPEPPPLGEDPLPAVPSGIEADEVMVAPLLPDSVEAGGGLEAYDDMIAELAEAA